MYTPTFNPCYDILSQKQKDILQYLINVKYLEFTLYGGTAVSLQLGHRISVDFDFFSDMPLDNIKERSLVDALPFLQHSKIIQNEINTRSYLTDNGIKLSFFGGINFGRVGTPNLTDDGILIVASLHDLIGTKLATILNRIEVKDYQDIAAILRSTKITLNEGLGASVALYGPNFPVSEAVRTLTYFEGGDMALLADEDKNILLNATRGIQAIKVPLIPVIDKKLCNFYFPEQKTTRHKVR
jgi:hypothetical protein